MTDTPADPTPPEAAGDKPHAPVGEDGPPLGGADHDEGEGEDGEAI